MNIETDIIIVGSGAAGLTAALASASLGAEVIVIEKSDLIGGTTAVSGGAVWVPNNHHLAKKEEDSLEEAFEYVKKLADHRSEDDLIKAFLEKAPEMLEFVEANSGLEFTPLPQFPDYYAEFEGGKTGGRSLDPGLFDATQLGEWQQKLRASPIYSGLVVSINEMANYKAASNPLGLPFALIQERATKGIVSFGCGLIGQLLKALLENGVEPMLGIRAKELTLSEGRVTGLVAEKEGKTITLAARKGVILASGGFEWNKKLTKQFLGGLLTHPNSPPSNEGDGLLMGMAAGCALANMSEAWWSPSLEVPEEQYENEPLYRADFANRSLPHAMIVNQQGKRFVNESQNYNDLMKAFFTFDPQSYTRTNLPAWLILESRHLEKYGFLTYLPSMGMPIPDWLIAAKTIKELANKLGIDGEALEKTTLRFNQFAQTGKDEDFQRGEFAHDQIYADPNNSPNSNLGPIEKAPFYAIQVHPGALGTKGGVKVNIHAQALDTTGQVIDGLYAAGNVMAGVTGAGYPGAGCTISSAMIFGFIAGQHIVGEG